MNVILRNWKIEKPVRYAPIGMIMNAEFKESEHPRAKDGKFGEGGKSKESGNDKKQIKVTKKKIIKDFESNKDIPKQFREKGIGKNGNVTIYHGTNSDFDKFDLSHIGQRATTEGWGIYLATDERNAKKFGKKIKKVNIPTEEFEKFLDGREKIKYQSEYIKSHLKWLTDSMINISDLDVEHNTVAFVKDKLWSDNEISKKLKTIVHNPKEIKKYLESLPRGNPGDYIKKRIIGDPDEITGDEIYKYLESGSGEKGASDYLEKSGIPGKIVSSNRDIHSVVDSPNTIIWDDDFLNKWS